MPCRYYSQLRAAPNSVSTSAHLPTTTWLGNKTGGLGGPPVVSIYKRNNTQLQDKVCGSKSLSFHRPVIWMISFKCGTWEVPQDHWSAVTASIFLASGLQFPFPYQADDDILPLLKRSVITTRWAVNSYCCWKKGFHKNSSSLLTLLMNMQFSMIWYMRNQKICAGDRLISLFLVKKEEWLANIFFASDVFNRSNGCERYN